MSRKYRQLTISAGALPIAFLVSILNIALIGCNSPGNAPSSSNPPETQTTYTTSFPLTENPISEGGKWVNGGAVGLDWGDVQTTPGLAFGTNVCGGPPYCDPTAVLTGAWPSDQKACATVYTTNQDDSIYEEVELRLRTTVAAHNITGYEFNYRATSDGSQYAQIVRWNGPLNSFTYVSSASSPPGLNTGDVLCATAIGATLTFYHNGVQIAQGTDNTFPSGDPGIGFYNQGGTLGDNSDFGFSSFTATSISSSN